MSANFSKKMPNNLPWKWSTISEPNLILFSITLIGWTISQKAGMNNISLLLLAGGRGRVLYVKKIHCIMYGAILGRAWGLWGEHPYK